jgi:hypothetical protein
MRCVGVVRNVNERQEIADINEALSFFEKTLIIVYRSALLLLVVPLAGKETTMNPSHAYAHDSVHDAEVDAQLCAYNAAFEELGLRFRWDAHTLMSLAAIDDEQQQIAAYIESHHAHLLTAYSAEFLSRAILDRKSARCPSRLQSRVDRMPGSSEPTHQAQAKRASGHTSYEMALPALAGA